MVDDMKARHEEESQKVANKLQKELEADLEMAEQATNEEKQRKLRELKNKQGAELSARAQDMTAEETQQVRRAFATDGGGVSRRT